jgi:diadenosine tetraphosphate (Ap4A) HIT family hydrolase
MPPTVLAADEHVVVAHLQEPAYLGYLFVEARRHVPELGDLDPDEASAVGRAAARWGRALQNVAGAEHVYAAVVGHAVAHFHLHLIPRYPGTLHLRSRPGPTAHRRAVGRGVAHVCVLWGNVR